MSLLIITIADFIGWAFSYLPEWSLPTTTIITAFNGIFDSIYIWNFIFDIDTLLDIMELTGWFIGVDITIHLVLFLRRFWKGNV